MYQNCIQSLFPRNYGAYENRQMRKTIDLIENGARPYLAETLSHIVEAKESLNWQAKTGYINLALRPNPALRRSKNENRLLFKRIMRYTNKRGKASKKQKGRAIPFFQPPILRRRRTTIYRFWMGNQIQTSIKLTALTSAMRIHTVYAHAVHPIILIRTRVTKACRSFTTEGSSSLFIDQFTMLRSN